MKHTKSYTSHFLLVIHFDLPKSTAARFIMEWKLLAAARAKPGDVNTILEK